jgi:hypothetical protein
MAPASPCAVLKVVTDGRFLCVEVINHGASATFSGVIQPGRGTASAAVAKPALWRHSTDGECRIDTGQSAILRVAQRDRAPSPTEDDDRKHVHPEGPQAWRMCYLKKGIGAALERICPVEHRSESDDDGVVLTVMSDPPLEGRAEVKSISLRGDLATDLDNHDQFRVLDSPRHYHAKTV